LLIEPMVPETDAAYCVHRLFAAHDRAALIAAIGFSVRAIVTDGGHRRQRYVRTLSGGGSKDSNPRFPALKG
jgi:hypothetical protein